MFEGIKLLDAAGVAKYLGIGRTTLFAMKKDPVFPTPVRPYEGQKNYCGTPLPLTVSWPLRLKSQTKNKNQTKELFMVPRGVSKSEFKRLTVDEYLRGDYGVTREVAEELAEVEWQIRQEVEGMRRMPSGVRKESNPHAGFGLKGIWLGEKEKKPQPQPSVKLIVVSSIAFKVLRSKGVLSPVDISWLFSGETEFLVKYASPLGFPSFEPRIKGYRTWRVYEWLGQHAKHGKIKVRA